MSTHHSLDTHMNFRMSSEDKCLIEMAAKLRGLKPNTYARQKLLEVAEKDIASMTQVNTLILNDKEWNQFVAVMESPDQINENLKKAVLHFNEMIKK